MKGTNYLLKRKTRPLSAGFIRTIELGSYFKHSMRNTNEFNAFKTFKKERRGVNLSVKVLLMHNPRITLSESSFRQYLVFSPFGQLLFSWIDWLSLLRRS